MLRAINHMLETVFLLYSLLLLLSYSSTFQADILLEIPPIQPVPAPRQSSGILSPFKASKKSSPTAEPHVKVPGVNRLTDTSSDSA